jgi:nitroreductase
MEMDLLQTMRERRSIRAFKPDSIPRAIVEKILNAALQAPSAINLQPWKFVVVAGEEKERLCRRLIKSSREKKISCGPQNIKPLAEAFSKRGIASFEMMKPYLDRVGLQFDAFINEGSCNFYGAPTACILCLDDAFSKARLVDMGIAIGYLVLTAHSLGIGSCIVGLVAEYEDDIKEVLDIPENENVVIGIALGYPDWESPINAFKTQRDTLDRFLRWIE